MLAGASPGPSRSYSHDERPGWILSLRELLRDQPEARVEELPHGFDRKRPGSREGLPGPRGTCLFHFSQRERGGNCFLSAHY